MANPIMWTLQRRFAGSFSLSIFLVLIVSVVLATVDVPSAQDDGKEPVPKRIRLHVIGLDSGKDPAGLKQLEDVSRSGRGTYSVDDGSLSGLKIPAPQQTTTGNAPTIVAWPRTAPPEEKPARAPVRSWQDPRVQNLAFVVATVLVLIAIIGFRRFILPASVTIRIGQEIPRSVRTWRRRIQIGRDPSCQVVVTDPYVSKRHVTVDLYKRKFRLSDEGSENGVYIDQMKIARGIFPYGTVMKIGKSTVIIMRGEGKQEG